MAVAVQCYGTTLELLTTGAPILSYGTGSSVRSHSPLNALISQLLSPRNGQRHVFE